MAEVSLRQTVKKQINKLYKFAKEADFKTSIAELQIRRDSLIAKWAEFQENHKAVLERTGKAELELQEIEFDDTEQSYFGAKLLLDRLIKIGYLRRSHHTLSEIIMNQLRTSDLANTESAIRTCISDIDKLLDQFNQLSIDRTQSGESSKEVMQDHADTQRACIQAKGALADKLGRIEIRREPQLEQQVPANNVVQELRLAPIALKKFSGDPEAWEEFRDTFKQGVHDRKDLNNIVKFQHLKSVLINDADDIIRNLPLSEANYTIAWNLLLQNYNNKHALVKTHLKSLFSQTKCKETEVDLRRLINKTSSMLHALSNLECPTDQWDVIIVYITVERLDSETCKLWEQAQSTKEDFPSWNDLETFLHARVRTLMSLGLTTGSCNKPSRSTTVKTHQTTTNTTAEVKPKFTCADCAKNHATQFCYIFRRRSLPERKMLVNIKKLCPNCLAPRHTSGSCPSSKRCIKCNSMHHTLMHDQQLSASSASYEPRATAAQDVVVTCTPSAPIRSPVLLSTALVTVKSGKHTVVLRALIDCGSQASFMTESAAQLLKLPKRRVDVKVSGVASVSAASARGTVSVNLTSRVDPNVSLPLEALVLRSITSLQSIPKTDIRSWDHLKDLCLADPNFDKPEQIDLLLGADVYGSILQEGVRIGPTGTPVAQNTVLGWILSGPVSIPNPCQIVSAHCGVIEEQLRKFWEISEVEQIQPLSADELACEKHFASTHRRDTNGRYIVRLPSKHSKVELGESYKMAALRLFQMERRFLQDNRFSLLYHDFMNQYISLQHMELVEHDKSQSTSSVSYYIPHHAVIKEASTSTKLRVVFDASRKSTNGRSLNEQLHIGPRLQQDLTSIIMRWRKHAVVFTSDVEKMFRQIMVDERDRDLQRILWRPTPNEPIRIYRLTTVTYGTTSAPYLANKTLRQLALDEAQHFPLASDVVLRDVYVDDILSGADDISTALNIQRQLIDMLQSAGLTLRKWASNREEGLTHLPRDFRECSLPLEINLDERIKTLGIQWFPACDDFGFSVDLAPSIIPPTKRSLLSDAAKLFDPLGWLAPSIIIAKLMFQNLWTLQLMWDDPLPIELAEQWLRFRSSLHNLTQIRIKRWIHTQSSMKPIQIHGFCDASLKAYAAVVYVRVTLPDGSTEINLIASKTKVAPIKTISLPKLELCGAALLAKLIDSVIAAMNFENVEVYAWTDSEIVLAWLKSPPNRWNVFVANRVADIHGRIPIGHWGHVRSEDNPADCASRGLLPEALIDHPLWWTGPGWLSQSNWPTSIKSFDTVEEERKIKICLISTANDNSISPLSSLMNRLSDWNRLVRTTAYCLRAVKVFRKKMIRSPNQEYTANEITDAKSRLYRQSQIDCFKSEYYAIKNEKTIDLKSKLSSLNVFIDQNDVLRVGGRLKNATMHFNEKHPIVVPSKSILAQLLIRDAHIRTLHGGTQITLGYIRHAHWLIDGRNLVRHFIHKCPRCIRFRATRQTQIMADLPAARVSPNRPFLHTCVDYSGAVMVRSARGRGQHATKAYISVFICLTTKATHIELVSDLTSAAFIAAFRRFTARRGICSDMYSDNGTNFVGADVELQKLLESAQYNEQVYNTLQSLGTTWHFSPPIAPHFNGMAESGVRSIKHHLRRVIGESTLTNEEMSTFLSQVEACLNSRPLYALTNDSDDVSALTPGHFLIGEPLNSIPEPNLLDSNPNRLDRWKLVQLKVQQVWKRWSSEYVHHLQQRNKWRITKEDVKKGDVVLIIEDNMPPGKWALGIIEQTHPGPDGRVRVATIRSNGSIMKRPIVKLVILLRE